MSNIFESAEQVCSREDFVKFVWLLLADLRENPEKWQNKTLVDFLGGVEGWVDDAVPDFYLRHPERKIDASLIPWGVVADILASATIYE